MDDSKRVTTKININNMEKLSKEQKVSIVSQSEEIMTAVKMLIALMEDADLKNNITIGYDLNNENYELSFTKIKK